MIFLISVLVHWIFFLSSFKVFILQITILNGGSFGSEASEAPPHL